MSSRLSRRGKLEALDHYLYAVICNSKSAGTPAFLVGNFAQLSPDGYEYKPDAYH